jgi:hypothetical protein
MHNLINSSPPSASASQFQSSPSALYLSAAFHFHQLTIDLLSLFLCFFLTLPHLARDLTKPLIKILKQPFPVYAVLITSWRILYKLNSPINFLIVSTIPSLDTLVYGVLTISSLIHLSSARGPRERSGFVV